MNKRKKSAENIKDKIKTILQLPTLPKIATEVVDLVDNPKTNAMKLGRVILSDQGLTAKVLKIANSPFYGFPRRISTVEFAIIVLGFDALKEIVISISLVSALQKKSDDYFQEKDFWDHAITTATVARRLARDLDYRVSGEAFVGGLLHDMGISILHRYFNSEFKQIVEEARSTNCSYIQAEEQVLGVTHAEVGGWLAERWNLPDHLIDVLFHHHVPEKAEKNPELVALIHCADIIANRLNGIALEYDKDIDFSEAALNILTISDRSVLEQYYEKNHNVIDKDIEQQSYQHKKN